LKLLRRAFFSPVAIGSIVMGSQNRRPARRDISAEREDFLSSLRSSSGSRDRNKTDHRAIMFCRQVQRSLAMALAGEVGDEMLQQLTVESVKPAPTCNHLLVSLGVPNGLHVPMSELLERIERITPIFRRAIAADCSRKRVPELSFIPVAIGGGEVLP
jgi:ribosome-binding factor A